MRPFYQDHPDVYTLTTPIIDVRPGGILVERSPFFPGGGGQIADRGVVVTGAGEFAITAIVPDERGTWLEVGGTVDTGTTVLAGASGLRELLRHEVALNVDVAFRALMSELHTLAHVANSVVFTRFGGALLTGAQLSADGSLRIDFDLPDANNEHVRALEEPINAILRADVAVGAFYLARAEAEAIPGMFRSKSVAPPAQPDGLVRIVDIAGIDRQACGGTHVASTGVCRPCRIVKVENKGRHNRRMRLALVGSSALA